MAKNKVVLLAPTPPPYGGIASWTVRMLENQLKNNWEIKLVDIKILGSREVFGNKKKYNIALEIKRCFLIWNNLRKALNDPKAKVVHSCIPASGKVMLREYICAVISHLHGRPFIMHFRCTVPNTVKGKLDKFAFKRLCGICDEFILLNQQSVDFMEGKTKAKLKLIPNFTDVSEMTDTHEIRQNLKTILYVGGCIRDKGCVDIIQVAKDFPEIEFRLVGNPESDVESAASNVPNVILTGVKNKEQVQEEIQNADLFMFLSRFSGEGFSNSLVEAMAAGLPCIVTDWAANADMIENNGGVVVPIQDINAVHNAIEKLSDIKIRQDCADFNYKKVRSQYSNRVVLDQYVDCYEEFY